MVAMHKNQVFEGNVDLTAKTENRGATQWAKAQVITTSDPQWQSAASKRGITDFSKVFCVPLNP